jgi:hypothetical protein
VAFLKLVAIAWATAANLLTALTQLATATTVQAFSSNRSPILAG